MGQLHMKNILIFSSAYLPFVGGAEVALTEITKRLSADFNFTLITYRFNKEHPETEMIDGVKVHRLGYGTKLDRFFLFPFLAYLKGREIFKHEKVDLLWGMMVSYASIGAYLLKILKPNLPFLLTLQEGDSERHLKRGKLGLLGFWWRRMLKKANYIQAISAYLADYAVKQGARQKIAIIPNGVALANFDKISNERDREKTRKFLNLLDSDKVIMTSSRLVTKNAVDILIRSLKFLGPSYVLLVAGTGVQEEQLKNLAEELDIEEQVLFLGQVPQSELFEYLAISSVFSRPSRSEGLGNSFLEAMAVGVPVVGTKQGGIPDFLKDGETGLFCKVDDPEDLASKIRKLSENDELRNKIIFQSRKLVRERYSWGLIALHMKGVFTELIADEKPKIVFASGTYSPEIGGMATFVKKIAGGLTLKGFQVSVLAYGKTGSIERNPFPVQLVSRSGGFLLRYLKYFLALRKTVKKSDLIYAQDLVSSGFPAALVSLFSGKKLIIRLGGDFLWEQMVERGKVNCTLKEYYTLPKSFVEKLYLAIYRFVLKRAELIIFNNSYQPELYNQVFGKNINFQKIVFNPISKKAKTSRAVFDGDIVYFGRFIKVKNLKVLIKAFGRLKTKKKLVLVGEGPGRIRLERLVEKLSLRDRVQFKKAVPRVRVFEIMQKNSLVVIPTLTELNPNVALEALSVGTPVLLTKENGLPREVKDELQLFNPLSESELFEKLEFFLDKKNYQKYESKLRRLKYKQTWDSVVTEHIKVFENIL
ncbi:MAG: hypothetical protein COT91_00450 [Candidatus Doudnabacteria bacterium CG10_big_fil_rev_8_21_14_0_10_41_10]|uniref:Glycosyltransferase n=1 Tax=Candidatus Doudnabacteria bacterium CG10_big_fil_rev_8_21_14_0_10_41_10 TaxID=1974551 RepID=A0A2H0VET0_9BACT|nr:MAG: hypothetical protein COT91_00450 [Candidatus Doudnabacteria bacterium CG10_big_fil_rev_8_21_14_0_10_41_10]